jgi:hypothetical protein
MSLRRLEALLASWTPEERVYCNLRFREIGRRYAQLVRLERNAQQTGDDWLATTWIARAENDDAPAP